MKAVRFYLEAFCNLFCPGFIVGANAMNALHGHAWLPTVVCVLGSVVFVLQLIHFRQEVEKTYIENHIKEMQRNHDEEWENA